MSSRSIQRLLFLLICLLLVRLSSCGAQEQGATSLKRLVVGTRSIPPFAMKNDDGDWSGVSIGLWKAIAADLKVTYELKEYNELSELLTAVEKSEVDVAVAGITVTAAREKVFDFSMPIYTSGIGVAVRKSDRSSLTSILTSLLSAELLGMMLAMLVVMLGIGMLAWLFERKKNSEHFQRKTLPGIWDGFWFAAVTMTTVGYGDKSPKTIPGRVLALAWMFIGIVVISLFTAAAASALTEASLVTRIQRTEDLLQYRCGTVGDSTSGRLLTAENISFRNFENLDAAMKALAANKIDACIFDAPTLRYYSHTRFGGSAQVLPVRFESASYAFALPSGSPLREPINQMLLKEVESDGWPDRVERLLGR